MARRKRAVDEEVARPVGAFSSTIVVGADLFGLIAFPAGSCRRAEEINNSNRSPRGTFRRRVSEFGENLLRQPTFGAKVLRPSLGRRDRSE